MSTQEQSPVKNAMNYGAIIGIALIIISLLFYMMNDTASEIQGYLSYLVLGVGIYIGVKNHRDNELSGLMSYGKALGSGTLISFFASIIAAFYIYLFVKYFDESMIQIMLDMEENKLIDANMPDKEIKTSMNILKMVFTPIGLAIASVATYTLIGFIISLVTSAFLKKQDDSFDANFQ